MNAITFVVGDFCFAHKFWQVPSPRRFAGCSIALEKGRQTEEGQFTQHCILTDGERSDGDRLIIECYR